jgi:hypothetical protein
VADQRSAAGLHWSQNKHPAVKLEAIKAVYVVNGTLETNSARRASPPENPNDASGNIYTSLFQRLALASAPPSGESPPQQDEKVYDLFPQPPQKEAGIVPDPLPAPGESIDDPPTPPSNHPRVITVEIG